jgi:hypothetical protein
MSTPNNNQPYSAGGYPPGGNQQQQGPPGPPPPHQGGYGGGDPRQMQAQNQYALQQAQQPPPQTFDKYVVIHVATTCDEHGVYVTKDSAEVIEIGWVVLDARDPNLPEVCCLLKACPRGDTPAISPISCSCTHTTLPPHSASFRSWSTIRRSYCCHVTSPFAPASFVATPHVFSFHSHLEHILTIVRSSTTRASSSSPLTLLSHRYAPH